MSKDWGQIWFHPPGSHFSHRALLTEFCCQSIKWTLHLARGLINNLSLTHQCMRLKEKRCTVSGPRLLAVFKQAVYHNVPADSQ